MSDYKHILVAVDFSTSAEQVVSKARDITNRNKAKLTLLHIVEYLPPIDSAYEPVLASNWIIDENEMLEQARQSLQQFSLKHGLSDAEYQVILGTPKYEIAQYVRDHGCDLVVLAHMVATVFAYCLALQPMQFYMKCPAIFWQ